MPYEYCDVLHFQGADFGIDSQPFELCFEKFGLNRLSPVWPISSCGYVGYWEVQDDRLFLEKLDVLERTEALPPTFESGKQVSADWFTGHVHSRRGLPRWTGYPARKFWNQEVVLDVVKGVVTRYWELDLSAQPNQADEELIRSVPSFLLPDRLRT